jgi:hypothetical protein
VFFEILIAQCNFKQKMGGFFSNETKTTFVDRAFLTNGTGTTRKAFLFLVILRFSNCEICTVKCKNR